MRILLTDPLACTDAFVGELHRLCPEVQVWQRPELPADGQYDLLLAWRLPADAGTLPTSVKAVFCFGAGADHLVADSPHPRDAADRAADRSGAGRAAARLCRACGLRAALRSIGPSGKPGEAHLAAPSPPEAAETGSAHRRPRSRPYGTRRRFGPCGAWLLRRRLVPHQARPAGHRLSFRHPGDRERCARRRCADQSAAARGRIRRTSWTKRLFSQLEPGAYLANLGRGGHLDEEALRAALDGGRIGAAWLDAFRQEPLASDHWFWCDPRVHVTPHNGGLPTTGGAAKSLAAVVKALQAGEPLPGLIRAGRPSQPKISP